MSRRSLPNLRIQPTDANTRWVLAAPFRAHVSHLIGNAQVPWPVVAYQAGVPLGTLRTLLFGRHGRPRGKITHEVAQRLFDLRLSDLARLRVAQTRAEPTSERIRSLRDKGATWEQIGAFSGLTPADCQSLGNGTRPYCSVATEILVHTACEEFGLTPWKLV